MIWDEFTQPSKDQLLLKLAITTNYGNWSWAKDSDGKVGIALELPSLFRPDDIPVSKYFEVKTKSIPLIGNVLTVFCTSLEFHEIFEVLCRDLIKSAANAKTAVEAISLTSKRIDIWSKLFSRGFKGLTVQQVIGLIAELLFLKIWISAPINGNVNSWSGPKGTPQDFIESSRRKAIEVKALGRSGAVVKISSIDQLDFDGDLYLATFPVYVAKIDDPKQTNIDELVAEISDLMTNSHQTVFNQLLLQAGFVPDLYKDIRVSFDEPNFFRVEKSFPKITRLIIPKQILSARYEIDLSSCKNFKLDLNEFLDSLL